MQQPPTATAALQCCLVAVRIPGHGSRRFYPRPWYSSSATPGNSSADAPGKLLWCDDLQAPFRTRVASTSGKTLSYLHQLQCLIYLQAPFRNQGGFNIIGSGRDKIENPEQLAAAAATVRRQMLHSDAHWLHCIAVAKHSGPDQLRTRPVSSCHGHRLLRRMSSSTAW